jgi:hypothetical protein
VEAWCCPVGDGTCVDHGIGFCFGDNTLFQCCYGTVDGERLGVCCPREVDCLGGPGVVPQCCPPGTVVHNGACVHACVVCDASGGFCCATETGSLRCCSTAAEEVCTLDGCCLPSRVRPGNRCFGAS